MTNTGESVLIYNFEFPEASGPLPPGQFNISCVLNGEPSPNITYQHEGGDNGIFLVDNTTGVLSLSEGRQLDYETITAYTFTVSCSAPAATSVTAQVIFSVLPVNEFRPMLSNNMLLAFVTEAVSIGTVLLSTLTDVGAQVTYSAVDMDAGPDGDLHFTLADESSTSYTLDNATGTLTVTGTQGLDVDSTVSGFRTDSFRMTVCDVSPPADACPNVFITVVITGANDNDPEFAEDVYRLSLTEEVSVGSAIINVSCTDSDVAVGQFKNITTSSDLFNVTELRNGLQTISLADSLNFETASLHTVTLTCFDTGDVSDTALLVITVGQGKN